MGDTQTSISIFADTTRKRRPPIAVAGPSTPRQLEPADVNEPAFLRPSIALADSEAPVESRDPASQFARLALCTKPEPTCSDDGYLVAILDAPLLLGEPAAVGFSRKERELRAAFAQLTILAARAIQKRLANPQPGDLLAEKFSRLTVERRNRLLQFLADARRRAAVSPARR